MDTLVSSLRSHVVENYDADPEGLEVLQPGETMGLESDFEPQCGESTGGFTLGVSFLHTCRVDCSGDTIATMYTFEVERDPLGGEDIPSLSIEGEPYTFGEEQHTWYDVDPFDGDPARNDHEHDPPPRAK